MVNIDKILKQYDLFWQYPVITEKVFYMQNKNNTSFLGFPWATMWEMRLHQGTQATLLSLQSLLDTTLLHRL